MRGDSPPVNHVIRTKWCLSRSGRVPFCLFSRSAIMPTMTNSIPGFDLDDLPTSPTKPAWQVALLDDRELVADLSRYSLGILSQQQVRKKYRFSESVWELLATDDELIRKVELETTRRERSGESKRELAQKHIVRGPDVLAAIMDNPKESARHRVDSVKVLNSLT